MKFNVMLLNMMGYLLQSGIVPDHVLFVRSFMVLMRMTKELPFEVRKMLSKRMLQLIQRRVGLDVNGYAHDYYCNYLAKMQ
jgi:hypothetical protein